LKVKKSVSLEDKVIAKGKNKAKTLGFDFSSYLTYLINKDCGDIKGIEEISTTKTSKLSSIVSKSIDNIMNIDDVEIG
jgi:hypothetical protein